jgi:hypothetical protein
MLANRQVAGSSVASARVAKPAVAFAPARAAASVRQAQRPALARRMAVQVGCPGSETCQRTASSLY